MSETHSQIITAVIFAGFAVAVSAKALLLSRINKDISVGPILVFAGFLSLCLYGFGSGIDLLADWISDEKRSIYDSFVERLTLGRFSGLKVLLPLRERPLLAAPIYTAIVFGLYLLLFALCWWLGRCRELSRDETWGFWPGIYRRCGYQEDLGTIEPRFVAWLRPMVLVAPLLLFAAFWEMFDADPKKPPLRPYLWATCVMVWVAALLNWIASRSPAPKKKKEAEPPRELPPLDPMKWLAALQAKGFKLSATPALSTEKVAEATSLEVGELTRSSLMKELVRVFTRPVEETEEEKKKKAEAGESGEGVETEPELIGGLWAHQREAMHRVAEERQAVLMATPPRSGKSVTAQLLSAHVAVVGGKNALLVLRDRETAQQACDLFTSLLAKTSWAQNLRSTVSGPQMIAMMAQKRSPVVAFTDPDALDAMLAGHQDYAYFLEHLGLLVVEDLERHSGVRGANLHFIMRRLLAVFDHLQAKPLIFSTLGLPVRDFERYAETLLGVDLQLVASDGAEGQMVHLYPARGPQDASMPPAAIAAAEATSLQLPLTIAGFASVTRTELDRAAALATRTRGEVRTTTPEKALVSLAELSAANLPRLIALTRHIGAICGGEHHQVLMPRADPLARWLAADIKRAFALAEGGRTLIADPNNHLLASRHLEQALSELPAEEAWIRNTFGDAALVALDGEQSLLREKLLSLEDDPVRLSAGTRVSLRRRGATVRGTVDAVDTNPVKVIDRSTGMVIRRLDPCRAPLVAYPGAVLLYRGRRFVVPLETPSYERGAQIPAELCEEDIVTVRVRRLDVSLLSPEELRPLSLGGETVAGGVARVRVKEEIVGQRRHAPSGKLRSISTFEPVITEFETEARVLSLGALTTEPAAHALVHTLRPVLEAYVDCGEEGLHVAHTQDLAGRGPALLLIDTFPFGVGYARAVDLGLLGDALELVRQILGEVCCDGSGCERCIETMHCHQTEPNEADLDRAGAQSLLVRLLGE